MDSPRDNLKTDSVHLNESRSSEEFEFGSEERLQKQETVKESPEDSTSFSRINRRLSANKALTHMGTIDEVDESSTSRLERIESRNSEVRANRKQFMKK